MPISAHKNFALSTMASPPSSTDGTSLTVATGTGTRFPAVPFNATLWPASVQPTTANAEIVRVTNISTDVFTVARAQEGSTARAHAANDQIAATITARTLTDAEYGAHGVFNVKDPVYGAMGDGITDDTAAIQAAVDAANTAGGGRVYLPEGTYKVTAGVVLQSNVTVYGDGIGVTTVNGTAAASTAAKFSATSESNLTIRDLSIGGTHAWGILISGGSNHRIERCAISGGTNVDASGAKGGGLFVENTSKVFVKDNQFSGNGGTDVNDFWDILFNYGTYTVTDFEISGNICASATYVNIGCFDTWRGRVTNNRVSGAITPTGDTTNGGYGIMLYTNTSYDETTAGESVVSDNIISGVDGTGIYIQQQRWCTVTGNVIRDCASVQTDASLSCAGIAIHDSPGCTVTGNRVYLSGRAGIEVTSSVLTSDYTTVAGNTVENCARLGICLRGTVADVAVTGNVVINCVRDGIGSYSDVAATRVSVIGNVIRTITGGGYRGVYAAPTATSWTIKDNTISDLSGGGQAITATGSTHVVDGWSGSKTWDPGNVGTGAQGSTTVTVTGAALGDRAVGSFSLDLQVMPLVAYVSSANTVTVVLQNLTGGAVDLGSGTLSAWVKRNC